MGEGVDFAQRERWLRQQERDAAAEKARARAARTAALAALVPAIEAGDVGAMARCVELVTQQHGITMDVRAEMPAGVAAYASGKTRIVIPPISDARTFSIALHEIGHCLSEPCGGGDHQPDPTVTRWHHCVRCETLAWERAMKLAPFSHAMFATLEWALGSYRQTTPAPRSAEQAADRLRSFIETYTKPKNARVLMQHRQDLVNTWKSEAQDRRPRPGSLDYYRSKLASII